MIFFSVARALLAGPSRRHDRTIVVVNWRDLEHPEAGGAELVSHELAARLSKPRTEVIHLCAAVAGQPAVAEHPAGYRIVRGGSRFGVYLFALVWLALHRARIAAVVDCQNGIPFFTPLVLPRRTPLLLLIHHVHQEQFAKYFSPTMAAVGRWLEGPASRRVYGRRGIVTVSPTTRAGVRSRLKLRGNIWVAPPGWQVSTELLEAPPARSDFPHLVSVGRLVPHKRTERVIDAMPQVLRAHPDARLTVVGRGPERARLVELAGRLNLLDAIDFRDDLDDLGRDQVLASGWLLVHASQGEGWGLSVLEGNAFGTPSLAYRVPGLRDSIVPRETGWLIDPTDDLATALTSALTELSDPGRAGQITQRARHWANRFSWARMAQQTEDALRSEAIRLNLDEERRVGSDVATIITLPAAALPQNWQTGLRATDSWERNSPDQVTVLCRGADTQTVPGLIRRLGVEGDLERDAAFSVSVARTHDLLRVGAIASAANCVPGDDTSSARDTAQESRG